jgi:hypothetical protein
MSFEDLTNLDVPNKYDKENFENIIQNSPVRAISNFNLKRDDKVKKVFVIGIFFKIINKGVAGGTASGKTTGILFIIL